MDKILTEDELYQLKERVQSFLNEIKFELYIVGFSKLCSQSSIICFQKCSYMPIIMLEFYKRISGNKQNTYIKYSKLK